MPDEAIRANLKRILLERGLSARGVSKRAGLSESAIKHILNGQSRSPRHSTLQAIAGAIGVSVSEITGAGEGVPSPLIAQLPHEIVKDQAKLRLLHYWNRLTDEKRHVVLQQIMDSILSD